MAINYSKCFVAPSVSIPEVYEKFLTMKFLGQSYGTNMIMNRDAGTGSVDNYFQYGGSGRNEQAQYQMPKVKPRYNTYNKSLWSVRIPYCRWWTRYCKIYKFPKNFWYNDVCT